MSKIPLFKHRVAVLLVLAGWAQAHAQGEAADKLLKGRQVTRDALINALKLEPAGGLGPDADGDDAAAQGQSRGFKLATAPAQPAATARKASLLITFAVDSAKLTRESMAMLDTMAEAMQSKALAGASFAIEGHADPRGDEAHNLALSQQRAQAVMDYLVEQRGIARDSLSAQGKGASQLLNPRQPEAPENRRVTFVSTKP